MAKKKSISSKKSNNQKSGQPSNVFKPFPNYEGQGFETFLQLLNRNQVAEFECEDFRIQLGSIATQSVLTHTAPLTAQAASVPMPVMSMQAASTPTAAPAASTSARPGNQKLIRSPFVGTFYTSPAPGKPPYIQVGTKIKPGDTLCIVEAMKLMNEIESEFQGKVIEIIAQNGRPVEFDEPLLVIEIS